MLSFFLLTKGKQKANTLWEHGKKEEKKAHNAPAQKGEEEKMCPDGGVRRLPRASSWVHSRPIKVKCDGGGKVKKKWRVVLPGRGPEGVEGVVSENFGFRFLKMGENESPEGVPVVTLAR